MENIKRMQEVMCNVIKFEHVVMKSDCEAGFKWNQKMSEDDIERMHYLQQEESFDGGIETTEDEVEEDEELSE